MKTLSPPQLDITTAVAQGVHTLAGLASRLNKSEGIIKAQITRIKNAGHANSVAAIKEMGGSRPQQSSRPLPTGSSSNQQVLDEAKKGGEATYEIPEDLINAARKYGEEKDVHPMVLMGCTIQFVKLVGGRLSAHMLIEEVYEALRVMVSDGSPKVGSEDWSQPWPLNAVELENQELKTKVAELEKTASGG